MDSSLARSLICSKLKCQSVKKPSLIGVSKGYCTRLDLRQCPNKCTFAGKQFCVSVASAKPPDAPSKMPAAGFVIACYAELSKLLVKPRD